MDETLDRNVDAFCRIMEGIAGIVGDGVLKIGPLCLCCRTTECHRTQHIPDGLNIRTRLVVLLREEGIAGQRVFDRINRSAPHGQKNNILGRAHCRASEFLDALAEELGVYTVVY